MKTFLFVSVLFSFFISISAEACECEKYPLPHGEALQTAVSNELGRHVEVDLDRDVTAIKAYPTLVEKLDLFKFKGTSCEVEGPNGEFLYHCINKVKYDYLVKARNCELVVQVKSTYKNVAAKVTRKTCAEAL